MVRRQWDQAPEWSALLFNCFISINTNPPLISTLISHTHLFQLPLHLCTPPTESHLPLIAQHLFAFQGNDNNSPLGNVYFISSIPQVNKMMPKNRQAYWGSLRQTLIFLPNYGLITVVYANTLNICTKHAQLPPFLFKVPYAITFHFWFYRIWFHM